MRIYSDGVDGERNRKREEAEEAGREEKGGYARWWEARQLRGREGARDRERRETGPGNEDT